ncbi:MAG TPA: serine/threonine-protein kinase [Polyangiaceae bacterium]|jgi:serine/threonine-protein kinase
MGLTEETRERANKRVGTMLRGDKYVLEQLLGAGAMGAVYGARHRNGMRVAIKVLHPELSRIEEIRRRFLREGYIANRVSHPGTVKVLDDDVDEDGTTFLVMELLEGRTLEAEWTAAGSKLSAIRVAQVAERVLAVVAAIHAEGIVHRDIKPDNVFLTTGGAIKVLDLGIARLVESRSATATGQMMGTPEFVAPEQAAGNVREIDGRTDLYSVGAMMFALITGEVVHPGRTGMEQMVFAATRPARSLLDVWPDAPPLLANVIDVALSFDKSKRWATAAEMQTALATSIPRLPDGLVAPSRSAAAPPPAVGTTGTLILGSMQDSEAPIPLANRRK